MRYEYKCQRCGRVEVKDFPTGQAPSDYYSSEYAPCPDTTDLKHVMLRVYGVSGIVFKGKGFYTTDSRRFVDVDTSKVPKHMLDR